MNRNELIEWRKKHLEPIEAAARKLFNTADGKKLLEALDRVFVDDSIPLSGPVDANRVLVNAGARQVIDYLRKLAEPKEGQGT